jgi:hypothetical protein
MEQMVFVVVVFKKRFDRAAKLPEAFQVLNLNRLKPLLDNGSGISGFIYFITQLLPFTLP